MEYFDKDPLYLLDDDGDGGMEMCLFSDEDGKKSTNKKPSNNSGCAVILLAIGTPLIATGLVTAKIVI